MRLPWKTLSDRSPVTYALLAFVAMAGLAYINYLPSVVAALAGQLGFGESEAGQIVAVNGYGGIAGSILAVFVVRRVPWRSVALPSLLALASIDAATAWIESYEAMLAWRGIAGLVGGGCVGITFAMLARLDNPDRAFGMLLFVQFCVGSLVIYALPTFDESYGAHAVFHVSAIIAVLAAIAVPFLPRLPLRHAPAATRSTAGKTWRHAYPLMGGIFCYQCAASAIWAYVALIGASTGVARTELNLYIATAGMLGLAGSSLPVIVGKRGGRRRWVMAAIGSSVAAAMLLAIAGALLPYALGMALLFFSWPALQSYSWAVTADMDPSGRLSTVAAVVASLGLATGPMLGASLLDGHSYASMLAACVALFVASAALLSEPVRRYDHAS